jgi:FG-GAP-like repeat
MRTRRSNSLVRSLAVAILLAVAPLLTLAQTPAATIKTYSLGKGAGGASWIATGDVNGDGFLDLVTSNESTSNISVLLGDGKGDFAPALVFPTGSQPRSIALADFNRDGKLDVVTANFGSGTISVLFGNGDGTFQAPQDFPAGIQTQSVVVGDLNKDGIPDIVVASVQSENVDAFLSNGDGTFQPPIEFVFNNGYAGMTQIALGDMNRDGILDVVGIYGYGQGFQVWLGKGDGSFHLWSNSSSYGTIAYPHGLALGDFTGNGHRDVALGMYTNDLVGVSVNQGGGNFSPPLGSQALPATILLAAADLNNDGKLDAISTGLTSATLDVALGQGNGYFGPVVRYKTGTPPTAAVVGNFNHNKIPDIAFTTSSTVGVILR